MLILLGEDLEEQTKIVENQGRKQAEVINVLKADQQLPIKDEILKDQLSKEVQNEPDRIEQIEKSVNRGNLYYKKDKYTYSFCRFETIGFLVEILVIIKLP